jgi:mannose-6-phosphate isomerase-like protein (cupin superfamily)
MSGSLPAVVSAMRPLKHYGWGAGCDGWNLVDTPELSVKQERMPPHTAEAEHYHRVARQFFFILEGTAVFELTGWEPGKVPPGEDRLMMGLRPTVPGTVLADGRVEVGPREGFEIAPGIKHRILNESESDLVFVLCSQPSTTNDRIEVL